MFVLINLDTYGYEDGGERVEGLYGPFGTLDEAEAMRKRVSAQGLVGVEYRVQEIQATEKLIAFLNQLGFGKV